jgi:hypothetical protein
VPVPFHSFPSEDDVKWPKAVQTHVGEDAHKAL